MCWSRGHGDITPTFIFINTSSLPEDFTEAHLAFTDPTQPCRTLANLT
jgi:hypothetical protein